MKLLKTLIKEMDSIKVNLATGNLEPKDKKKLRTRFTFLNVCSRYLESEPKEDFIKSEAKRVRNKLKLIDEGHFVDNKLNLTEQKKDKKLYNKLMGVPDLKRHLNTLIFLLND